MADEKKEEATARYAHPMCSACTCARTFTDEPFTSRAEAMTAVALALCSGIGETIVSMLQGGTLILCHEHAHDVAEITQRLGLPPSQVQVIQMPGPGERPS